MYLVECSANVLRHDKVLRGIKAPLLLEVGEVVLLERLAVHVAGALPLGAKANGGRDLDHRGAVLLVLGVGDGRGDGVEIGVAILDVLRVPAVGSVTSKDVL